MLEGYGLHKLVWDACDERFGDVLVASPANSGGRGISLAVRQNGAAADLTGATVYFVWKHKVTGKRGTELFTAVDTSAGTFEVYYPAAMREAEGAVQAQVMVSRGDDTYISSRVFTIRVEPVVIGGEEHEDGFTLFVDAINAYEHAIEITTDAATAANQAAAIANTARENLTAAAERGDFDGVEGVDGFSPTATVTQKEGGCTIKITDKNGTTTADVAKGVKGDKGATGPQGPQGPAGTTPDLSAYATKQYVDDAIAAAVSALDGTDAGDYQAQPSWRSNGTWATRSAASSWTTGPSRSTTTSGASVCKLGAGGVLTDPNDDRRTWFWAHYYADGEGVLTATATPDAMRELVASGRICAIGKYVGLGFTPWDGMTSPTHRQYLTSATFASDMATFSYLNLNYLFYTFSGCSHMTTIYTDSTWALPTSGITGSQCFYSCGSLVGGNGTAWVSSKTAYTYFRIDTAKTPGYITAA